MNSDALLTNLKARCAIPPAQVAVTDTSLLNMATEEMIAYICPLFDQVNEEFFTTSLDTPVVSGTAGYDMPTRAMSGALRVLKWVDQNGVEAPQPIPRIEIPDIGRYVSLSSAYPLGFYFTATQVVALPTPTVTGTLSPLASCLRMYYSRRPGSLVTGAGTAVCVVTGITDTVITAASVNTTNFAVNATVDIISSAAPFKMRVMDGIITASNATTITIGAGGLTAAGVAIGDYVTLSQTSYVPQIPLEWHSLLELRVATRAFGALGDYKGRQEAAAAAKEMEKRLMAQAAPRSGGNSKKWNSWRT